MGVSRALQFAIGGVGRVSRGSVRLGGRTYAIEGEAATPEAFVRLAETAANTLPASLELEVPGREKTMPALDLLRRTVFYKVGHHCSHNATLKKGGLELMTREDLVAFIPLDQATAAKMGTQGWEMPAAGLFKALKEKTDRRVVMSDVRVPEREEALNARVRATDTYVDYFLR